MQNFINNWATNLLLPITDTDTQLIVPVEMADLLTPLGDGFFYLLTLAQINAQGFEQAWEVVKVDGKDAGALFVERAQEGTTALAFTGGASISARLTRSAIVALQQGADIPAPVRFFLPVPDMPGGSYFDTSHIYASGVAQLLGAEEARLWPWSPIKTVTIDSLSLRVTTAQVAGWVRIGIYAANEAGWPSTLMLVSDEFSVATTGFKEVFIPATILEAGKAYWWVVHSNGTPQVDSSSAGHVSLGYVGTNRASLLKGVAAYGDGLPPVWPFNVSQISAGVPPIIKMRRA